MQGETQEDDAPMLLAIVEVAKADRIQCQAEGCGHSIYKRIHVVLLGLQFSVVGSRCYRRLYRHSLPTINVAPQYGSISGRLLTAEERLALIENTAKFIEALEAERTELERLAALEADRNPKSYARPVILPQSEVPRPKAARDTSQRLYIEEDARSPAYEGSQMLRWQWRTAAECISSVASYQSSPGSDPTHATVMARYKTHARPTPYLFALDVELASKLPKSYIFRALDELGLIEQM